jgi:hypothetical protein
MSIVLEAEESKMKVLEDSASGEGYSTSLMIASC